MPDLTVAAPIAGAVLFALLALLVARRTARRSAHAGMTTVVSELTARVDELARDLQRALERAESRGEEDGLTSSIELDEVAARVLESAKALAGIDAALVSLQGLDEDGPFVAATGITQEEAERQAFPGPPGAEAQAISVTYRTVAEGAFRAALALPLAGLGFLAVYSRAHLRDDVEAELEELARRAVPAFENAVRFREARRLADLDALTGLHNRRYFHETLAREVARAHRYGRRLALLLFDLDDFKAINERIGHLAGDEVLAEAATRVREVVRESDIACRVGGDEFGVILPESGVGQAEQLFRRIQAAVSGRPIGHVAQLGLSAGVAELDEKADARAFFERADEALYRAKDAGKARAFPAAVPKPPAEKSA